MLRIAIFQHVFLDFTAPKAGDYIFCRAEMSARRL